MGTTTGSSKGRRRLALGATATLAVAGLTATGTVSLGSAAFADSTKAVQFTASDDGYTSTSRVAYHAGGLRRLVAGNQGRDRSVAYLKFTAANVTGAVRHATVTLTRDQRRLPRTLVLARVAGTGWSESGLTQANAPRVGATVATVHPGFFTTKVTFDVSAVVTGPGTYAFAVLAPGTGTVAEFRSSEAGGNKPTLTLSVVPTPQSPPNPQVPGNPQSPPPVPVTPSPAPSTSRPSPSPTVAPTSTRPSASPTVSPTVSPTRAPVPSPSASPTGSGCTLTDKLVPRCNILWGAAAGGFTTTPRDEAQLAWEKASGRPTSVYHTYHRGDELFPTASEIAMARDASAPRLLFLNWKVAYGTTWAAVAAGKEDARIDTEAAYIKANFPEKFFLTLNHEPENDVNPTAGSGMTAADFAAMFRHTVLRLRADGVTNMVSVVVYMSYEKWFNSPWWGQLYPGDDVVDWIGLDAYLTATPGGFHYGTFSDLMDRTTAPATFPGFYTWTTTVHPNKPFMLAEWGIFENTADPSVKAKLFSSVLAELSRYPAVKGMLYFDSPHTQTGGDLRIDSSAGSLSEFRKIAADPRFVVRLP